MYCICYVTHLADLEQAHNTLREERGERERQDTTGYEPFKREIEM